MDFFNREDIDILARIGGTIYRKSNAGHVIDGEFILKSTIAKTEYWANELQKLLPDFKIEISHHWQRNGYFTHYAWAKIYKPQYEGRDIYFTIGVEGKLEGLVYKLDYQSYSLSTLSVAKQNLCSRLIGGYKLDRKKIDIGDLNQWDWDKLIADTASFIRSNEAKYDLVVSRVWKRCARICWNTNNWIFPSGVTGKSRQKNSYERQKRYGHEEWLFDFEKTIDGYHYAFLESVQQTSGNEVWERYEMLLWTINSTNNKRFAVANIRDVEIIGDELAKQVMAEYSSRGWIMDMERQIKDVNGDIYAFRSNVIFNVRFKPESVEPLYPFEIPADNHIMKLKRYRMNFQQSDTDKIVSSARNGSYVFVAGKRSETSNSPKAPYIREMCEIEILLLHRKISDNLTACLADKYGSQNISQESSIGNRRIDIVRRTSDGHVFYEVKTYPCLRTSIREALGQLLEYAFYPNANNARKLVIVVRSDHSDVQKTEAEKYMTQLRKLWNLPIYLSYFDNDSLRLSKEY